MRKKSLEKSSEDELRIDEISLEKNIEDELIIDEKSVENKSLDMSIEDNGRKDESNLATLSLYLIIYYSNIFLFIDLELRFFFHIFAVDRKKSFYLDIYI